MLVSVHRLAGALLCLCASSADAQQMPLPEFKPGDRWVYLETDLLTKKELGRSTEVLVAAASDGPWLDQNRFGRRSLWRMDAATGVPREQFDSADGQPAQRGGTIGSNDGGCAYPWPLKVGQTFSCSERTSWSNGWKVRYDIKFTVEALETVQTAAGSFEAYKLVGFGQGLNESNSVQFGHERLIWLAPAVKREVKSEHRSRLRNGQFNRVEGRELMEYRAGG